MEISKTNYRLPKITVVQLIGLVSSLFLVNAPLAHINEWTVSLVIFFLSTVASFYPSTQDFDGNWYRPFMKVTSIVSFLGSLAGYLVNHPQTVINPDGTTVLHYAVPVILLQSIINSLNLLARYLESTAAKEYFIRYPEEKKAA